VSLEYVSIWKARRAVSGMHSVKSELRRGSAATTLAAPTMPAVQESWKGPGIRHASGVWVFC
jgi:hypothetical protein